MSHELRTPLSAILGWAVIARRHAPPPDVDRALCTIERNARAQMRIIEDVLDVGRIISGKLRLEISATKVAEVIEAAVQVVRPAADAKQVKLDVYDRPGRGRHRRGRRAAAADRLERPVQRAQVHAQGGPRRVAAKRAGSTVVLTSAMTVRASGPSSCPTSSSRSARPTVRRRGATVGSGLGLAIVKQLVQAHGGQITAQSDGEGKGAVVHRRAPGARTRSRPSGRPADSGAPCPPPRPATSGWRACEC